MGRHYEVEEYGYKTAEELGSIVDSYTENPVEDTERLKDYLVGTIKNTVTGAVLNTAKKYLADKVAFSVAESINLGVVGDLYSTYALVTAPFIEVMGAMMAGFGVGCVSYDLAPEFWTDVSNEVLGYFGVEPVSYEEIANLSMVVEVARHPILNTMLYGMPYPVLDVVRAYMKNYTDGDSGQNLVKEVLNPLGNPIRVLGGSIYEKRPIIPLIRLTPGKIKADWLKWYGNVSQRESDYFSNFISESLSLFMADTTIDTWLTNNIAYVQDSRYGKYSPAMGSFVSCNVSKTWQATYIRVSYGLHPNFNGMDSIPVSWWELGYPQTTTDYDNYIATPRFDIIPLYTYHYTITITLYTPEGMSYLETDKRYEIDSSYSQPGQELDTFRCDPRFRESSSQENRNYTYYNISRSLPQGITQDYTIDYSNPLEEIIPDKVSQEPNVTLVDDEEPTVYKTVYIPVPDDTVTAHDPTGEPEPIPNNKEIQFPNPTYHPTTPEHPEPSPYPPYTGFKSPYIPYDGDCYTGMFAIYNPTKDQVISLSQFLWSSNFIDAIKKLMGNPMDSIITLHKLYCTPETLGTSSIFCGYVETPVSGVKKVYNQFARVDCGILDISEFYNNVRDYEGYTTLELYLPFCTIVNLNVNDFMGKKIHVVYEVDVITGSCVAMVSVVYDNGKEKLLYTFNGNCAVSMPITSGGYNNLVSSLIGIAGSVATKNVGGVLGGVMSAVGQTVSVSGSISSNNGAMLPKKPYVLITRKVPNDFERRTWTATYQDNTPFTNLNSVTLPSGDNLIRIQEPRFNISGTSAILPDELEELKNIVSSGFYVHR